MNALSRKSRALVYDAAMLIAFPWAIALLATSFKTIFTLSNEESVSGFCFVYSGPALVLPLLLLSVFWPRTAGILMGLGTICAVSIARFAGGVNLIALGLFSLPTLCLGFVIATCGRERIVAANHGKEMKYIWTGAFLLALLSSYFIARPFGVVWIEILANELCQTSALAKWERLFASVQDGAPIIAAVVSFGPLVLFARKLLVDIRSVILNARH